MLPISFLPALLAGCLEPDPVIDTGTEDTSPPEIELLQGQISSGDVALHWRWREAWETGACVEFGLENLGPPVEAWSMTIGTDESIDPSSRPRFYNAQMVFRGNRIDVTSPFGAKVDAGDTYTFEYCAEPQTIPLELVDLKMVEKIPEEEETPPLYGTLVDQDDVLGIEYKQTGTIAGGDCLFLTVVNLSTDTLLAWWVDLEFRSTYDVTWSSGQLFPTKSTGSTLRIEPKGPDAGRLEPYAVNTGEVCIKPLLEPTVMRSGGRVVETLD
jgi:hypothetical protein